MLSSANAPNLVLNFTVRVNVKIFDAVWERGITYEIYGEYREYVYSVAVYQKYLTRLGELIIFEPSREKLSFLPTSLDNFDIRQHYICILSIFQRLICRVLLCITPTNMNLAVYGNGLGVVMTS